MPDNIDWPSDVFDDLPSVMRTRCVEKRSGFLKWCNEYAASKDPQRSVPTTGSSPQAKQPNKPKAPQRLGDRIESALKAVGITEERVSAFLGAPCGCAARKKKLNDLQQWAEAWWNGAKTEPPLPANPARD